MLIPKVDMNFNKSDFVESIGKLLHTVCGRNQHEKIIHVYFVVIIQLLNDDSISDYFTFVIIAYVLQFPVYYFNSKWMFE